MIGATLVLFRLLCQRALSPRLPLPAQNCILHRVLVKRVPGLILGEGDELQKKPFPAHPKLFTQALGGDIVILDIGVEAAYLSFFKQPPKQRACRFVSIASARKVAI